MVFLLVGPPALCRAGVLVACCDRDPVHESDRSQSANCCPGDDECRLQSPCDEAPSEPTSDHRTCDRCAGVCAGVARLSDDISADLPCDFLPLMSLGMSDLTSASKPLVTHPILLQVPRIPFPASDVPLLI